MHRCCICERLNRSDLDENRYVLMETSPKALKRHLIRQGYEYRSYFFLCHRCKAISHAKLKLLLKYKQCLIKEDIHFFRGGEVTTKSYWFTLEINVYGYICIYDKKTRALISEKKLNNEELIEKVYKKFLNSVLDDIWNSFD